MIDYTHFIDLLKAIIPEVLKTLDVLGIKLSMERLCFENGATAPLKIQRDIEEVTSSGVRESPEKISAVSIKTENDDPLSLETASSQTKEKITKKQKKEESGKKEESHHSSTSCSYRGKGQSM